MQNFSAKLLKTFFFLYFTIGFPSIIIPLCSHAHRPFSRFTLHVTGLDLRIQRKYFKRFASFKAIWQFSNSIGVPVWRHVEDMLRDKSTLHIYILRKNGMKKKRVMGRKNRIWDTRGGNKGPGFDVKPIMSSDVDWLQPTWVYVTDV